MDSLVLGFDPGIKVSGYGIIRKDKNTELTAIDYGIIENTSPESFPLYLEKIYDRVVQINERSSNPTVLL